MIFYVRLFTLFISFFSKKNYHSEFSIKWWFWLIFTGITMACCVSVKFVGLFQMTFIGLMTIADLWTVLGKLSKPIVIWKNILKFVYYY